MFLGALVLLLSTGHAVTPEQVLKTAWSDKTYVVHDEIQSTDSKNPFKSIEASASQEGKGEKEIEYGLKFNLKSYPEWKSGRSGGEQRAVLKESALAWALRDRYGVLLNYEMATQKMTVVEASLQISEKQLKAQTLSLRAGKSNSKTYLDAKAELLKLERTKLLLEQEMKLLQQKMQRWLANEHAPELKVGDLLEVDEISKAMEGQQLSEQSLTGKLAKEEINEMDQELQIVRGRERQWFKSFDVAQVRKKDEDYLEFGVTINLPPLASDDYQRQRQNELILKKALKQRDFENNLDRLSSLRFQILNSIEIFKITSSHRALVTKAGSADPLVNIQTRLAAQQEQLDLLNQRQSITTMYLDYLLENEILSREPEKNHLSAHKAAIL
jgi:hypothetical protein